MTPVIARRRAQLATVAEALRELHRQLMEEARRAYEREAGPVGGATAFLNLLMQDPAFQWLRPLSRAMADLDELLDLPEPAEAQARGAWSGQLN